MWDAKEPTPMFEKSRGRRPRWCSQPLRVVGLGRDAPCMGPMSSVRVHSLWAGLCTEKLVKKKKRKKKQSVWFLTLIREDSNVLVKTKAAHPPQNNQKRQRYKSMEIWYIKIKKKAMISCSIKLNVRLICAVFNVICNVMFLSTPVNCTWQWPTRKPSHWAHFNPHYCCNLF